ncbi:Mitotic spindle checkpoint protein BUBR1 [Zea mays]|uniref:Mitotic spindle checkpoint protein BUBR1 n=1 Tax=Zea mays TaxID=4577 RepID=A0A3L6F4R5_MAIZE|nr:Mitotic spindle checkpoint protein BUBR1 [Zea mays]
MASPQADEEIVAVLDEETLALMGVSNAATAARVAVGAEWEKFKENVRPLKRGHDVSKLNHALAQGTRQSLPAHRSRRSPQKDDRGNLRVPRRGSAPTVAGLHQVGPGVIPDRRRQCVRTLWHDERYKDDIRFLKVWLEYF